MAICGTFVHSTIFSVGIGGNVETKGSLLNMINQTVQLPNLNFDIIIDLPTYIDCGILEYGHIRSLFCPDVHLYNRWQKLFLKLVQKHSFISVHNILNKNQADEKMKNDIVLDCLEEGTVLSYGDSRCEIELPNGLMKPEEQTDQCERLVPFILPSGTKVTHRKIIFWTGGNQWKLIYLPCVAPLYICGYGPPPSVSSIQYRRVPEASIPPLPGFIGHHVIVRNVQYDCLMGQEFKTSFQDNKVCVFYIPQYNTTKFNIDLEKLQNDSIMEDCLENTCMKDMVSGELEKLCVNISLNEIVAKDQDYYNPVAADVFTLPNLTSVTNRLRTTTMMKTTSMNSEEDDEYYYDLRMLRNQIKEINTDHKYFQIICGIFIIILFLYMIFNVGYITCKERAFTRKLQEIQSNGKIESKYQNITPPINYDDDDDDDDDETIYEDTLY